MENAPATVRDLARLHHIVGACTRITTYTAAGQASLDDERTYDAVLRCLTIVGEALGALSEATHGRLSSLPPGLPKAHRNLIVHEYWRIDPEVIWATVETQIPQLRDDATRTLGS